MPLTQTGPLAMIDLELLGSLVEQLETAVSLAGGRHNLPLWIERNTRNPTNPVKPWSFEHHEYQIGILNDQSPHIAVQKPAQTGVSELITRATLGLLAKMNGIHAIYCLPSSKFASKFATSRIDPVIKASPRLQRLISKEINSNELKMVGSSYLHIAGAAKETQAISIPATVLIRDEISFGNPAVLATFQSRLEHALEHERTIIDFSTPLFPGMGISELFEQGTQNVYMCYHDGCGQWVEVDSVTGLRIPQFDEPLSELTKESLITLPVEGAFFQCPNCSSPISRSNLADPTRRAWVPRYPSRRVSSYQVDPLDVAGIRSPAQVVRSLSLYRTAGKWIQYGLGRPFLSAEAQIVPEALERAFKVPPMPPSVSVVSGAVAGMDIGIVSHFMNGKVVDGRLEVFNVEKVKQDGLNRTAETFLDRFRAYRCVQGVIDSGPDVSIVRSVQGQTYYNAVLGCQFVRSAVGKGALDLYAVQEAEGVVKVRRTAAIDEFVKEFNRGNILLPKGLPFEQEVREHLDRPKRAVMEDAVGEEQAVWVSKGADHFFFALLYCWLAAQLVSGRYKNQLLVVPGLGAGNLAGKTKLGGARTA